MTGRSAYWSRWLIFMLAIMATGPISAQTIAEARKLNTEVVRLFNAGKYADAAPMAERVLAIYEKRLGPEHLDVGDALHNLADTYIQLGRYGEAEPLAKRSLAIREKALGHGHTNVGPSLYLLGRLYRLQGRYSEAEPLIKRDLASLEKSFGPSHRDVGSALHNLADLYNSMGRHAEAEPLYKRSLAIIEKIDGPDHPSVGSALNNLALIYRAQGRYVETEALYKRSLAIKLKAFGPDYWEVGTTLHNIAFLYALQGRTAEAEALYERSLAITGKALGPEHYGLGGSLDGMAELRKSDGRNAEAEALYKRSLAIKVKALGSEHPDVGSSLNKLAMLYWSEGRTAEAEPLLKYALAIAEKALHPGHPHVGQALYNLAALLASQSRYSDALPLVRLAINRGHFQSHPSLSVFFGSASSGVINELDAFAESYQLLQASTSSAAADAVVKLAQRIAAGSGELSSLVRRDQDLTAQASHLDKALVEAVSKEPKLRNAELEQRIRKRLFDIETAKQHLASAIVARFPDYVALSRPPPVSAEETRSLLAEDEAVVVFHVGKTNSYAWVLSTTGAVFAEIPTNAKQLDEAVTSLRESLTFAHEKKFDEILAHRIFQQTFQPIAEQLVGKSRLSIVANGALTSIPLGLLIARPPVGKPLKSADFLLRTHAITVLPSIYSLKTMRARTLLSGATKPMIAFADPAFSGTETNHVGTRSATRNLPSFYKNTDLDVRSLARALPSLPGTRKEVETIARSLQVGTDDIMLGLRATEAAVKRSNLKDYRIVYFATHGLVSGDVSQFTKATTEPALAFVIPKRPTPEDDGLLQASEVAELKLDADWIVLSACNTASSDGVGAEALSGLARAFLYAGGRSLVVSHWDVSDEATAKLMSSLFRIAMERPSLSHGEAMREATLALLDESEDEIGAHPRVWAPFIVVGEGAVKKATSVR